MPTAPPAPWREVYGHPDCNTPAGMFHLEAAYALLRDCYPFDSSHGLSLRDVIKKLTPRKMNGTYLMNLRLFVYSDPDNSANDVAAFFFLRKRHQPAYSLTPAVLTSSPIAADVLRARLEAICDHMKNPPNSLPVEVVATSNPPVFPVRVLNDTFDLATTPPRILDYRGTIQPGEPWPNMLFRWQFKP